MFPQAIELCEDRIVLTPSLSLPTSDVPVNEDLAVGNTITSAISFTGADFVWISAGDPNGDFWIDHDTITGTASLKHYWESAIDYETIPSNLITLTIQADDMTTGTSTSGTLTLDVQNVAEAPVLTASVTTFSVLEDAQTYDVITSTDITVSDPQGDWVTLTLYEGVISDPLTWETSGEFYAYEDQGNVVIEVSSGSLDYETTPTYSLILAAMDDDDTATMAVTINVTNVDEAPVLTATETTFSIPEDAQPYDVVTSTDITVSDPQGDWVTLTLYEGDISDPSTWMTSYDFYAYENLGSVVIEVSSGSLDHEVKPVFDLILEAHDGSYTDVLSITVDVGDIPEDPYFTATGPFSVSENANFETIVGTLAADDPQGAADIMWFDIVAGNIDDVFAIDSFGTLTTSGALDADMYFLYILSIDVHDIDGNYSTATVPINVVESGNDGWLLQVDTSYSTFTIDEGQDVYLSGYGSIVVIDSSLPSPDPSDIVLAWDLNGDGDFSDASGPSPVVTWTDLVTFGLTADEEAHSINLRGKVEDQVAFAGAFLQINPDPESVPEVSLQGDITLIEGSTGKVRVRFRLNQKIDYRLTVHFTVNWATADANDIKASTGLTILQAQAAVITGTPAIPVSSGYIDIEANADGEIEGMQWFTITLVERPEYDVIPQTKREPGMPPPGEIPQYLRKDKTIRIYDGVTLFADRPLLPTAAPESPRVNINDVTQGGLGDCYLMATVAAVIAQNPAKIQNLMRQNVDGTFTVDLYRFQAGNWVLAPVTVNLDLTRGSAIAHLSRDVDANGFAEVWPQVLQTAYAQRRGGWANIDENNLDVQKFCKPAMVFGYLFGKTLNPQQTETVIRLAATVSLQDIEIALDAGNIVVVTTKSDDDAADEGLDFDNKPTDDNNGAHEILGQHTYAVRRNPNTDNVELYDQSKDLIYGLGAGQYASVQTWLFNFTICDL